MSMTTRSSRIADHSRRCGFTLVELLVVVAIVALLISILLPALNKARDVARTVACLSNDRGIGMLVVAYTMENQGYMPMASEGNDGSKTSPASIIGLPAWNTYFRTDMGMTDATLQCPSAGPGELIYNSTSLSLVAGTKFGGIDYAINASNTGRWSFNWWTSRNDRWQVPYNATTGELRWGSVRKMIEPAQVASFVEMEQATYFGGTTSGPTFRHNDYAAINLVFFDGHSQTVSGAEAENSPTKIIGRSAYDFNATPYQDNPR